MLGGASILLSVDVRGGGMHNGQQAIKFHLNSIDFQRRWWTRLFLGEHPTKEDVGSCRGRDYHGEILLYCSQRLPHAMMHDVEHFATNSEAGTSLSPP